jgi:hypothetical protein
MNLGPMLHRIPNLDLAVCLALAMWCLAGCQRTSVQTIATTVPSTSTETADGLVYSPTTSRGMIRQEVLLHAALYRAAYETNVGDFTRHFLLEPVHESNPPHLGVDAAEFKQQVLAELSKHISDPVAWVEDTWRTPDIDFFPGTEDRATRLRIRIFSRDETFATITGEVGDWTADVASSRQAVTATWDGLGWTIKRDRVRLVW